MRLAPDAFTLRQLQYAVAIAETRNFHRAAALCHVSQPSLSAQVAELEGALGVRLFERDRKRVLLTAAGRELVERARRMLLEMADLTEAATRFGDPLTGTLRLSVTPERIEPEGAASRGRLRFGRLPGASARTR